MNIALLILGAINIVSGIDSINKEKYFIASFAIFAAVVSITAGIYGLLNGRI